VLVEGGLDALLTNRPVTASRWGLERIEALMAELGRPEQAFDSFHIAGTNGKGSTAAFAAAVLQASGVRVGLYTSPHLVDFRERILVDGRMVGRDAIDDAAARILRCKTTAEATYFEVATALAFLCFAEAGVETAVVETGLGGRLDATSVVQPLGTAVTTIQLDHTELLGETVTLVAREKAGIFKPGVPVSLGRISPPALDVLVERAAELAAPLALLGAEATVEDVAVDRDGTAFRLRSPRWPGGLDLSTPLPGAHQADNAALAILMLERSIPALSEDAVRSGVASARIPGRFEMWRDGGVTWILDIAHNPSGLATLRRALRTVRPPRPWIGVVSILADKPWGDMLEGVRQDLDVVVLTQANSSPVSRRWDPKRAAAFLDGNGPEVRVVEDLEVALSTARELCGAGTVLVTGSAHTVGDARTLLDVGSRG